ncbi:MAG: hypothetical protein RLZZ627_980 [Pseudomonadota bacterium]|jgi:ABC-type branched-subunit amino acid transport system permease subunit
MAFNLDTFLVQIGSEQILDGGGLAVLAASILIACSIQVLFLRVLDRKTLKHCHEVGGYYFSVVATLYAVLIGLVVFDAQTRFEGSKNNVESEAAAGMMTYILAKSLPEPAGTPIRQHFKNYVSRVMDYEWDTMKLGKMDEGARDELIAFSEALSRYNPITPKEQILYDKLYDNLASVWDMRRQRLDDATYRTTRLGWSCILIGGAATIFFGFFFAMDNLPLQMVMTAILTLIISLNIYLVYQYGNPYAGEIKINKTSFQHLQEYVMHDR